ncbi:MAG TPA: helix-turn-helix transcriptional regulator [Chitinophagaceae bacterium]|nr:helix-turn-helix transcriptional regulator [Chitinophagaceae bacterium]
MNGMHTRSRVHEGQNLRRLRILMGMKQETLADALGEGWSQKKISLLEAAETIEPEALDRIAQVLGVSVSAIRQLDEGSVLEALMPGEPGFDRLRVLAMLYPDINPFEKWIEALEENKRLYERLLQALRDKVALLEQILSGRSAGAGG